MNMSLIQYFFDLRDLMYPQACVGCGQKLLQSEVEICISCLLSLPQTHFHLQRDNPAKALFRGRVNIDTVNVLFYFTKNATIQRVMHAIKYNGNKELAVALGEYYGSIIKQNAHDQAGDLLVPVPLHPERLKRRGYNQSEEFAKGLSNILEIPILSDGFIRKENTATQTNKSRMERWENVKDIFQVLDTTVFNKKNILIVDDVLTTGSTLEAAAEKLLQAGAVKVSIIVLGCVIK
jgi:ComF family protein